MVGNHQAGVVTCMQIVAAAILEASLGICLITELDHTCLGRIYIGLGIITMLGLVSLLNSGDHRGPPGAFGTVKRIRPYPS
jgi:hypothetical protein